MQTLLYLAWEGGVSGTPPPPASQAHSLEALKPSLGIPFECGWYSLHPQKPPPDLLAKLNASDCCQKSQIHWCLKMRRGETGSVGTGHTGAWCDPGAAKGPAIPSLWSPLWEEIIPQKSPDKTQKCYFSKINTEVLNIDCSLQMDFLWPSERLFFFFMFEFLTKQPQSLSFLRSLLGVWWDWTWQSGQGCLGLRAWGYPKPWAFDRSLCSGI